jgi:hypothetical protein
MHKGMLIEEWDMWMNVGCKYIDRSQRDYITKGL